MAFCCVFHFYFVLLLLQCLGFLICQGSLPIYKDPSYPIEARVEDLLSRMTLQEKIGQMTQIDQSRATAEVIQKNFIGSVLHGVPDITPEKKTPNEWADIIDDLQDGALSTRLGIPIFYGVDAVHGHSMFYGATIFPHNIGLGAAGDADLMRRIGAATAEEVQGTGMQYAFAPCVAVCRDPRWGRCYESYSEDPNLVRRLTTIIDGLQGQPPIGYEKGNPYVRSRTNVLASAKHYVGDGGTTNGANENNTVISYEGLTRIHMPPYTEALSKGICTIMVSYSSWNGIKMHSNKFLITDVLKVKLGFKGIVISDWEGIDKITSPPGMNYTYSVLTGINAGLDMVMVPFNYSRFMNTLIHLVRINAINIQRVNDATRRILRTKFVAGLFEHPKSLRSLSSTIGSKIHRELAREAVRKSLVLLKNGKEPGSPLLPLSRNVKRMLVAGSHANNLGYQCGGWTITLQGSSGNVTEGTTILEAIIGTVDMTTDVVYKEHPDENSLKANNFSYGIVVVGEPNYADTAGDNQNLTIPSEGLTTIQNVCHAMKCLVILISGRPLVLEPYLPIMDAFVAAWFPGSEGQGVADVIFGDYDFQGKLPCTWFRRVDQLPLNVGDTFYDPLFSFAFGLSLNATMSDTTYLELLFILM